MTYDKSLYNKIIEERKNIRKIERAFRKNNQKMEKTMDLKTKLSNVLPKYMMPGNVGDARQVTWPFWYEATFDFGSNPTHGPGTRQVQTFQVSQEASFLLMSIGRKAWDYGAACDKAPLQIEIRDRQSSRQFNDAPIPIQNIGKKNWPSILPTPMLISPHAFIDVTMTSWQTSDQASTGIGKHEFYFFGYRIRVDGAEQALSTIFG